MTHTNHPEKDRGKDEGEATGLGGVKNDQARKG